MQELAMNTTRQPDALPLTPRPPSLQPVASAPRRDRAREFGFGYGRSSGYGAQRHYVMPPILGYFRFC
jgi:hypothetical protein